VVGQQLRTGKRSGGRARQTTNDSTRQRATPVPDLNTYSTVRWIEAGERARHEEAAARPDMGTLPPTVIYPLTLPHLLQRILTTQSHTPSTTLVVCSTREAFLQSLVTAVQPEHQQDQDQGQDQTREKLLHLATPTLHNLFTARHVKVVFCASVQTLLAYFTSLKLSAAPNPEHAAGSEREATTSLRLVLVNPLSLHAATSSFSAQGLSRTFAAAVETSLRVNAQLVVAECQGACMQPNFSRETGNDEDENDNDEDGEGGGEESVVLDPWEQDVSILNVSAKKFGAGTNDRAWAGRTVKVKRIAARWFRFHRLDELDP
jgi:hypothetical protein